MSFYGVKIWDDKESYYTEIDVKQDLSFNIGNPKPRETILKKKPYVTAFGQANYWSGSCSGLFLDNTKTECEHNYDISESSAAHIFAVTKFLGNHKKKKLQISDDFIITIMVVSSIKIASEKGFTATTANLSFDWVQVGEDDVI